MEIPSGAAGVKFTLSLMASLVKKYKTHPSIRDMALRLTANLPQKDYEGELQSIFDYVQGNIRYTRDISGVETIQTPVITLQKGAGDCDDKSTLIATLLESIGFPTRFRAMGFTGTYCHVITEVLLNGRWLALDTTEPDAMGWTPPNVSINMYQENGEGLGWWSTIVGAATKAKEKRDTKKIESKEKARAQKQLLKQREAELLALQTENADLNARVKPADTIRKYVLPSIAVLLLIGLGVSVKNNHRKRRGRK